MTPELIELSKPLETYYCGMKTLHEETGNRICLDCKQHWYRGEQYTRKQWDDLMRMAVKAIEHSEVLKDMP